MSSRPAAADEVIESAAALRRRIEAMLNEIAATGTRLQIPPAPESLDEAKVRMRENVYRILVMGEAKRGKSTFINALMGEDILPTDVSIATSQVFYVQSADEPGYRLRFEDDSTRDITREELAVYGKESDKDIWLSGNVSAENALRWIEVDGPFPFIPRNIRVLDSPGLGALYARHAEITQRFVPLADAVIFVLASDSPLTEPEIAAIRNVLENTRHVFFIQTQIDRYAEETWTAILQRNREILNDLFFGQIGNGKETIRIWPVSGLELLHATHAPKQPMREAHFNSSQFAELQRGLRRFLFQATGCARIASALEQANQYQQAGKRYLTDNIKSLQEAGSEKRNEMQEKRKAELEAFTAEWGVSGSKRKELENQVRQIVKVSKQQFLSALQSGGRLDRYYSERIDKTDSVETAKHLAESISAKIPEYAAKHWSRCASLCRAGLLQVLVPALDETGAWDIEELQGEIPTLRRALKLDREVIKVKADPMSRLSTAWRGAGMFIGLIGMASVVVGPAAAVVGPVVAGGVLVKNLIDSEKLLAEQAQPYLRSHLSKVLGMVRVAYTEVNVNGELSIVERYFGDIERTVLDRISELVERRKSEMQQRIKEIEEAAQTDVEALKARIEAAQQSLNEWNTFGAQIAEHQRELASLYTRPLPDTTRLPPLPNRPERAPTTAKVAEAKAQATEPKPVNGKSAEAVAPLPVEERVRRYRAECARIVRLPTKEERNAQIPPARRAAALPKEQADAIYIEEWKKKEAAKQAAAPAASISANGSAGNPLGGGAATGEALAQYRALIRELQADGEMSEADYEQLETLGDRLQLARTARRLIEKEEGV